MGNKKKVLLVEDEVSLVKIVVNKFKNEPFETIVASNGVEGLELAKKEHPELILLDIAMPIMDGITMLENLREDDWGKNAKVIILTNLSDNKRLVDAKKLGADEYLIKTDLKIEEVLEKVLKNIN